MYNRIIFLLEAAFTQRDYNRFGFEIMQARGYCIEAWNLSPFLRPKYYNYYLPPDPINYEAHKLFSKKLQIIDAISSLSSADIVVSQIGLTENSWFIFRLLAKRKVNYGFCLLGLLPKTNNKNSRFRKLITAPILTKHIYNILKGYTFYYKKLLMKHLMPPSFLLVGGSSYLHDSSYPVSQKTFILKAHAFDYDRFLEEEKIMHNTDDEGHYALFLDEFVPYHPDYIHSNTEPDSTPGMYYPSINKFFDVFERRTGMKVVIAAHPSANYNKSKNPYNNRKIIFSKTISYTKKAKIILTHCSTSINYAIIYKKPVMFFYDHVCYSVKYCHMIQSFAEFFKQSPLDISDLSFFRMPELIINDEIYKRYLNSYIKEHGTPNKMIWDIFCDHIETLN